MENNIIEEIIENIFAIHPIIHRNLINVIDESISQGFSHDHFAILGMLSRLDALPVSEIGRRISISKPQMTVMIDKLADSGLVMRKSDSADRRIIHISITESGRELLKRAREHIIANLKKKLSDLSDADIELMSRSLADIKMVGLKIK